ncbi:MAG: CCA tRNA nucleotidyltransferase [Lachnospiraceae bacterium]|nr:CCA tRNA nucleotidyltransferase [Lachnospiraceae bacterium]
MIIALPSKVEKIIQVLNDNGYEAYAVGGCVRDSLLGREPEDWDITTSAEPAQIKALFRRTVDTGIKHGTVTVLFGSDGFEITTYRIDGKYEDNRHPKEVLFTKSLEEDLKRRDFTINAMAYNDDTGIVDLFDGLGDMDRKVIKAVGDARERFSEDALRILRALRFSAQLNYAIDGDTKSAIAALKDNLKEISAERIRVELQKLLMSDHPEKLEEMKELGITKVVLPEYDAIGDKICEKIAGSDKNLWIRLALLLYHFDDPRAVLRRLKYDNETIRNVTTLIRHADDETEPEPAKVRHAMVEVGVERMPYLISLKRALQKQDPKYIDAYEKIYRQILADGDCICLKDLSVTGNDLMQEFHMPEGRELGECLQYLFAQVLNDPSLNERETLFRLINDKMEKNT